MSLDAPARYAGGFSYRDAWVLAASVAIAFVPAVIGSLATIPAIDGWYSTIEKPAWTPPGALFGPVWTVLYALMGVSAWLVWRSRGANTQPAFLAYGVQLGLNAAWSVVFFGLHAIGWAVVVILALDGAVLATIILFRRHSRAAAWLLIPYAAWIAFATALNAAVWVLNA